eukprot:150820-Alexandrium_andersonii.AAC.1
MAHTPRKDRGSSARRRRPRDGRSVSAARGGLEAIGPIRYPIRSPLRSPIRSPIRCPVRSPVFPVCDLGDLASMDPISDPIFDPISDPDLSRPW